MSEDKVDEITVNIKIPAIEELRKEIERVRLNVWYIKDYMKEIKEKLK